MRGLARFLLFGGVLIGVAGVYIVAHTPPDQDHSFGSTLCFIGAAGAGIGILFGALKAR